MKTISLLGAAVALYAAVGLICGADLGLPDKFDPAPLALLICGGGRLSMPLLFNYKVQAQNRVCVRRLLRAVFFIPEPLERQYAHRRRERFTALL